MIKYANYDCKMSGNLDSTDKLWNIHPSSKRILMGVRVPRKDPVCWSKKGQTWAW